MVSPMGDFFSKSFSHSTTFSTKVSNEVFLQFYVLPNMHAFYHLCTMFVLFQTVLLVVLGQPSCCSKQPTKSKLYPLQICPQIFGLMLFNASCYKDKLWVILLSKLAFNNMHSTLNTPLGSLTTYSWK
jgi:hypothetical protein